MGMVLLSTSILVLMASSNDCIFPEKVKLKKDLNT